MLYNHVAVHFIQVFALYFSPEWRPHGGFHEIKTCCIFLYATIWLTVDLWHNTGILFFICISCVMYWKDDSDNKWLHIWFEVAGSVFVSSLFYTILQTESTVGALCFEWFLISLKSVWCWYFNLPGDIICSLFHPSGHGCNGSTLNLERLRSFQ